jgi:hypothetical protein
MAEIFHVMERLTATEQGANRDYQDVDQVVILGAIDARIGEVLEVFDEVVGGMLIVHPDVKSQARDFRNQNLSPVNHCHRPSYNTAHHTHQKIFRRVCPAVLALTLAG